MVANKVGQSTEATQEKASCLNFLTGGKNYEQEVFIL
jgi:hypothetical protein